MASAKCCCYKHWVLVFMCITVYQNFIANARRFIIEMRLHQDKAQACFAVERRASVQHIFSPLLHCG